MNTIKSELVKYWRILYPELPTKQLDVFISELNTIKSNLKLNKAEDIFWYKNAVVYSLYVDLFNKDFAGLQDKIPYLKDLGVNCLWLLPVLDSPMRDAGFDVSDYRLIRDDLVGEKGQDVFLEFLESAHKNGIKVIFDIAINHTSNQHYWFKKSALPEKNRYTDYYIWSDNDRGYSECRLLFKGMCDSNWEKHDNGKFYFHRFFEFQPDLNYRNPNVLLDMCRNFIFWIEKGVDGFRADAIPYLWKEEGTDCENLDNTHVIIKFFRTVVDYLKPDVILLAEACQPPKEVVKYMGSGDECHAGYHFPLMPQIYKTIALSSPNPIINVLSENITPKIPDNAQWFTFLRCHDELSLELVYVSEEDRKLIHETYCHKPQWDFRQGEGISARLRDLFKSDKSKIMMAFNIIFSLPGTPVLYYGDEFAKENDLEFYNYQIQITGHNDTRNLVRGKIDWDYLYMQLNDNKSLESQIYYKLKKLIDVRKNNQLMAIGSIEFVEIHESVLAFIREYQGKKILVLHNLSEEKIEIDKKIVEKTEIIYGKLDFIKENCILAGLKTAWLKM
jgi:maltose alpha-D-glucosyltransferase / alpha-amylase